MKQLKRREDETKMKYTIELVHKGAIEPGDTILHTDGKLRTVCKRDIKKCPFMGVTIFGDSYRLGRQMVKKAVIHRAIPVVS